MSHNLSTRLALTAALTVGLLAASIAPASAAPPYDDGTGAFEAAAVVNPPPEECATYRLYNAELAFPDGATATVSSSRDPSSTSFQWGEFADGTYGPSTSATTPTASCTEGPGARITGFTGTLTDGTSACVLSGGEYQRGNLGTTKPELNVQYTFSTATGPTCTASAPVTIEATIPSVDLPTPVTIGPFTFDYVSSCNSPIAPQSCVLGPANY